MVNFAIIIVFIGRHPFAALLCAMPLSLLLNRLLVPIYGKKKTSWGALIWLVLFINISYGRGLSAYVLYELGITAPATIIGTFDTSTQYNNHNVIGYNVLIRLPNGKLLQSGFEDDDFNLYPSKNDFEYPDIGDKFNVRFLPFFPSYFVIVSNDDSPWANQRQCQDIISSVVDAESKFQFDNANSKYRRNLEILLQSAIDHQCNDDPNELQRDQQELEVLRSGGSI